MRFDFWKHFDQISNRIAAKLAVETTNNKRSFFCPTAPAEAPATVDGRKGILKFEIPNLQTDVVPGGKIYYFDNDSINQI